MKITTILCTYNRYQSLAKALDSLSRSVFSEAVEWEVLVVDNNSSDQTKAVVEEFSQKYPGRFRYLFEPQQGKSYALNAGIRNAHGEILAFVDDDVTVRPDWLQNLTAPLRDGQWAGAGGRILPMHGFVSPKWLALDGPRGLGFVLCAQFDLGDLASDLKDAPFGTNMAFRKEMFDKYGLFRTDLGPRPDSEMRNEDTEFGRRLFAGGERLRYVPSAVVYHEIHESRLRKDFFLAWWYERGKGAVREDGKNHGAVEIVKLFARRIPTAILWMLTFDPERRFYRKCLLWHAAGKMVEIYRQMRRFSRPKNETAAREGFGARHS